MKTNLLMNLESRKPQHFIYKLQVMIERSDPQFLRNRKLGFVWLMPIPFQTKTFTQISFFQPISLFLEAIIVSNLQVLNFYYEEKIQYFL